MDFTGAPRVMIVSDLDNTMVDHKDAHYTSLLRFGALWQADYNQDSLLVYSTGRSPALYAKLRSEVPLLTPGIAIMSVGTEIMYGETMAPDLGWVEELNKGWNRQAIVDEGAKLNLKFQIDSEQRPHKVSFYVDRGAAEEVIKTLTERFNDFNMSAKLIYSGGVDLDVVPTAAGKGQALAYLMKKLKAEGRSPGNTLVCGDSGNDAELFTVPDVYGVIVGNAMEELLKWHSEYPGDKSHIYLAKERCAAGILEAMQHFGLQPNVSPRDRPRAFQTLGGVTRLKLSNVAHEVVDYLLLMEHWLKADVDNTDIVFSRLKSSLVPDASCVHAYGIITNPFTEIETLRELHGTKKDEHFCIWVDRVRIEKMSDTLYLARFDKWEKSGSNYTCAITSAVLQSRIDAVNGLQWKLIHETWLTGREGTRPATKPEAPVQEAPVQQAPMQEAPKSEAPVQVVLKTDALAQEAPKTENLAQEAPKNEYVVPGDPKTKDLVQDIPQPEALLRQVPKSEALTQENLNTQSPGQGAQISEIPVQDSQASMLEDLLRKGVNTMNTPTTEDVMRKGPSKDPTMGDAIIQDALKSESQFVKGRT